jgi:hypothetical protein
VTVTLVPAFAGTASAGANRPEVTTHAGGVAVSVAALVAVSVGLAVVGAGVGDAVVGVGVGLAVVGVGVGDAVVGLGAGLVAVEVGDFVV